MTVALIESANLHEERKKRTGSLFAILSKYLVPFARKMSRATSHCLKLFYLPSVERE